MGAAFGFFLDTRLQGFDRSPHARLLGQVERFAQLKIGLLEIPFAEIVIAQVIEGFRLTAHIAVGLAQEKMGIVEIGLQPQDRLEVVGRRLGLPHFKLGARQGNAIVPVSGRRVHRPLENRQGLFVAPIREIYLPQSPEDEGIQRIGRQRLLQKAEGLRPLAGTRQDQTILVVGKRAFRVFFVGLPEPPQDDVRVAVIHQQACLLWIKGSGLTGLGSPCLRL